MRSERRGRVDASVHVKTSNKAAAEPVCNKAANIGQPNTAFEIPVAN